MIIYCTDVQREKYGLQPLEEVELLNQSAELKVENMFEKQYFAHTSSEGVKIKYLI